jgi:hypothetical protein
MGDFSDGLEFSIKKLSTETALILNQKNKFAAKYRGKQLISISRKKKQKHELRFKSRGTGNPALRDRAQKQNKILASHNQNDTKILR